MRINLLLLTAVFFVRCNSHPHDCFPNSPVSKVTVVVANPQTFGEGMGNSIKNKMVQISDGIGFVDSSGRILQKPLQEITLNKKQQQDLSAIFRPVGPDEFSDLNACMPVYRHVLLFYDEKNKLIGQANICLECDNLSLIPKVNCLKEFPPARFEEFRNFFKINGIDLFGK